MRSLILACTLICCVGAASAQSDPWPARTAGDVEAAYRLLRDNHPGAAPSLGDLEFQKKLASAHAAGASSARAVADYRGYVSVMRAFAGTFADDHLLWGPTANMAGQTPPIDQPQRGQAGLSLEAIDGGYWIGIGTFFQNAPGLAPFLTQVQGKADDLRAAKRVVIDLRGNAGGADMNAQHVLTAVFPSADVAGLANQPARSAGCTANVLTRASPGNQEALKTLAAQFVSTAPPTATAFRDEADKVGAALANNLPFSGPFESACTTPPQLALTASPPAHARVIVITDYACLSACLTALQQLKALGALQVGQTTRSANRYQEVRIEPLPSGLGVFTAPYRVNFNRPRASGPFEPTVRFNGNITDTAAVKAWVAGLKI